MSFTILPKRKKKRKPIVPGSRVWVRDNVTGLYHPGFALCAIGGGRWHLTDCRFVWCMREDMRTTRPGKSKIGE